MVGKIREQEKARKLRGQGRSVKEIARLLDVSQSSASTWVRSVALSARAKKRLIRREFEGGAKGRRRLLVYWREYRQEHPKPILGPRWPRRSVENFFDIWTPEMAYVLGYFAADGCMYRNARGSFYVSFTSTDLELIDTVKRLMGVTNNIEEYQTPKKNHKRRYVLQIGSRKLYERLLELGLTPNKSLTLKFPDVPDEFLPHFTRGYFDGDGCAFWAIYKRKNRPSSVNVLTASFISGSKIFLEVLRRRLIQTSHVGRCSLHLHAGAFRLVYNSRVARQLYYFMYPTTTVPCLSRKRKVFEKALKILGP